MRLPAALLQARQLEAAQLGSQRTEEQLVALSTQLSAAQEVAHEAAEAEVAAAREAASGEVVQAQAAAEEALADLARVQAELASVQAELAVLQEGGFAQIVSVGVVVISGLRSCMDRSGQEHVCSDGSPCSAATAPVHCLPMLNALPSPPTYPASTGRVQAAAGRGPGAAGGAAGPAGGAGKQGRQTQGGAS